MLKKTQQSIKLDWLKTIKQNTQVRKNKNKKGRVRRSDRITRNLFPSTPWKNFSFEWNLEPEVRGKNWNHSSSKGTWGLWEDLQKEQKRMEADFDLPTRSCYCSFEWLTTYSKLIEYVQLLHSDDRNVAFSVLAFKS